MVKVVEGASGTSGTRAWRGGVLVAVLGFMGLANACGGRTVWVEEDGSDAGQAGDDSGGVGGYGGAYGGGGDYGGGAYGGVSGAYGGYGGGGYGGTYGGYGGDYGGGAYGGVTGGAYPKGGTAPTGGFGGTGQGGFGGTGKGGFGGTIAGTAGMAGKGGCGAASGSGGGGSPGLGKACSVFCPKYPYASCPSDFEGPRDCLSKCQNGFGLGSWCEYALVDFLLCASSVLNPNAMCSVQGGQCYGPGCTVDAINACAPEYIALLECQDNPRPLPPCPPPPNPPLPPNCSLGEGSGAGMCVRETQCPNAYYNTECYQDDTLGSWYCDCYANGSFVGSVTPDSTNPCRSGAALCGFY